MLLVQVAHHARGSAAGATSKNYHIRREDEGQGEGGRQREGLRFKGQGGKGRGLEHC